MDFNHKSVMLEQCIESLKIIKNGIYLDGTIGGAGHSIEILKKLDSNGLLIGLDQDERAVSESIQKLNQAFPEKRKVVVNTNFRYIKEVCRDNGIDSLNGVLLDIGVSSYQLDNGGRGFSYNYDAELDMRMDKTQKLNAKIIVNEYTKEQIQKIIKDFGEEKWAGRIAEFIVRTRQEMPISTTFQLVDIIKAAIPNAARREGPHPAKRTFQAIRIAVNNELDVLKNVISDAFSLLAKGGRLSIISFHSLEDRIVKNEFLKLVNKCVCPREFPVCMCKNTINAKVITRKPIIPTENEILVNPRSRSAKLRVIEKI